MVGGNTKRKGYDMKKIILLSFLLLNFLYTSAFTKNDLYEKIDLFGEVLENIKNDYVDDVDQNDAVVTQGGACVMVAPMAQMFLLGSVIDYEVSLLESGFKFKNPNVTEECGCGESIKFSDT